MTGQSLPNLKSRAWKALPAVERFWLRVDKTAGCWLWTGNKAGRGYGKFQSGNVEIYAHRFSYEIAFGPIGSGLFVCHHCDNPACVRPDHLFVGTPKDNSHDCAAKGRLRPRFRHGLFVGEAHDQSKLTEAQVIEIRSLYRVVTQHELARRFGVSPSAIATIHRGASWRYLGRAPGGRRSKAMTTADTPRSGVSVLVRHGETVALAAAHRPCKTVACNAPDGGVA